MASKKAVVWVVEMWNEETEQWEPVVACELTKREGYNQRRLWEGNNPSSRFRVSRYVRQGGWIRRSTSKKRFGTITIGKMVNARTSGD